MGKFLLLVALPEELDAKKVNIPVAYTGVGISNAALFTYEAILKHKPNIVINYGSAGSLTGLKGLQTVGKVCQRDANCEPLRDRGYMLGENILYYNSMEVTCGVKCGSGNNFVTNPDQWTIDHCDLVDMELWSIAKVCKHMSIPWISKKWVSDDANGDAGMVWEDSLAAGQSEFLKWYKNFIG